MSLASQSLGQPVVIDNRPGADGIIADRIQIVLITGTLAQPVLRR